MPLLQFPPLTQEMESYEDDLLLALPENPPSPIPQPKLKRLKKAAVAATATAEARASDTPTVIALDPTLSVSTSCYQADLPEAPKVPDSDRSAGVSKVSRSEGLGNETGSDSDLDPLFTAPPFSAVSELQNLEREREDEDEEMMLLDGRGESGNKGKREMLDGSRKEKSAKKRLSLDEEEIPKKKKKSRSGKSAGQDGNPKESIREKKRLEKERKVILDQIHAESQRLLRETRDASFKPMPLVQKPVSSVLEKIRLRKLEVLKRASVHYQSDSIANADSQSAEIALNPNLSKTHSDVTEDGGARVDDAVHVADARSFRSLQDPRGSEPYTKDDCSDSQQNDGENHRLHDNADDTLEISLPALPVRSSSRFDPADVSSSEEDYEKENIDPHPYKAVDMGLYPKGVHVKAFVDDEAEEEDDSDHDTMRFQENEEDDETDEIEVLNDLIATGFEEAPIDHEKRNQLHQKWLEQQDAAATDNVLQRIKCGNKQREPKVPYEEDDEEFSDDSEDETLCDLPPSNVVQKISKKAKQMIVQMFNDGNDVYVPSDDEETEQTLIRQRILKETEEPSFISPLEDENSREVFGLIKKLNIAPDSKKRGKASTSSFDMLMVGGNSNSSSKLSFVGRTTSNSLPSSHKQGSTAVRTFIFGRDDSNSRSGISTDENISDMGQKENQPSKTASTKSSSSQLKTTSPKLMDKANAGSGSSLFEILRQSSMRHDKQSVNRDGSSTHVITESQAAYQFSAFKLGKRFSKVESRI